MICLYRGRAYGIEFKTRAGRQSPAQKAWAQGWEAAGGVYVLARDVRTVLRAVLGVA